MCISWDIQRHYRFSLRAELVAFRCYRVRAGIPAGLRCYLRRVTTAARHAVDPEAPNDSAVEADYLAAPSHLVAEVLDGELFTLPRPRPRHAHTAGRLAGRLRPFDDPGEGEPGGWVILPEPELHFGPRPDKVVPDLAGWHRERLPEEVFADDAPGAIQIVPDWVCEVLSDRTERMDRGLKMRVYRREGVSHVWLVSPTLQTLEVYRLGANGWILPGTYEGDGTARMEPFDSLELSLATRWHR